jgi:uncharacterized protein
VSLLAPTAESERFAELDALRGVALFGVFLVNFTLFAGPGVMATEQQLLLLPTAALDFTLRELLHWLVEDKANTLFAFLFGVGFWLQLQRAQSRDADFGRIYRRRLVVLLLFGCVHLFFVWTWDILHLYALAGFVLLALRRVSDRFLLIGGLLLAVFGRDLALAFHAANTAAAEAAYADSAVLLRQAAAAQGDYGVLLQSFTQMTVQDYLLHGGLIAWFVYVLGRFLLGAWVGRRGWLTRAAEFQPGYRRTLMLTMPAGLLLEGATRLLYQRIDAGVFAHDELAGYLADALHLAATPLLAAGYVCAVVLGLRQPLGRRLLTPFAWAGRMALSNYVMQSLVYGLLLCGIGPGLALGGRLGLAACSAIVVLAYAGQLAASGWWLRRYRYGPLEWCWRALTYGERPAMRRASLPIR